MPLEGRWRLLSASAVALAAAGAVISLLFLITGGGPGAIYPGGDSRYTPIRPLSDLPTPIINPFFQRSGGEPIEINSSPPVHVAIGRIGVDAPVISLGLDPDLIPEVPDNGAEVAWYDFSAAPGQGGNAVLGGHVTLSKTPAVFWSLKDLSHGDEIRILTAAGNNLVYRVFAVYLLDADDPESVSVIQPAPFDVLTLVTCGGQWRSNEDERFGGSFRDRIVVQASLFEVDGIRYDVSPNFFGL